MDHTFYNCTHFGKTFHYLHGFQLLVFYWVLWTVVEDGTVNQWHTSVSMKKNVSERYCHWMHFLLLRLYCCRHCVLGFLHQTCNGNLGSSQGCGAFGNVKCCLLSHSIFGKMGLFCQLWMLYFHCPPPFIYLFIYFVKVCKSLLMVVFHKRFSSIPGDVMCVLGRASIFTHHHDGPSTRTWGVMAA